MAITYLLPHARLCLVPRRRRMVSPPTALLYRATFCADWRSVRDSQFWAARARRGPRSGRFILQRRGRDIGTRPKAW